MSFICASSPGRAKTPRVPSSSPPSAMTRTTSLCRSVPLSAVNHGAWARSSRSGVIEPPMTAVSWVSR
jgi:hypothetical protein